MTPLNAPAFEIEILWSMWTFGHDLSSLKMKIHPLWIAFFVEYLDSTDALLPDMGSALML